MKLRYVLGVVFDLDTGFVVGLTKKKGPAFLINKICFPGGKVEGDESVYLAMTREMQEETGLAIPANAWTVFDEYEQDGYLLTKLAVSSPKVLYARTREDEPVWHLAIKRHLEYAVAQPNQYAPDFLQTLKGALAAKLVRQPLTEPV